jgi:hypothetical protein
VNWAAPDFSETFKRASLGLDVSLSVQVELHPSSVMVQYPNNRFSPFVGFLI